MFSIYYTDGSRFDGETQEDWLRAPDHGVQVVVKWGKTDVRRWAGVPVDIKGMPDRELWTGDDIFDPFGWGPKSGEWMGDDEYLATWERALGDSRP